MVIETYAMESRLLRRRMVQQKGEASAASAIAMTRVYLSPSHGKIDIGGEKIICGGLPRATCLRTQLAILARLEA